MKKILATTLASALVVAASYGQGTVSFKNYFGTPATDPAVYYAGGASRVTGTQYLVGLLAGPTSGSEVGTAAIATTPFLTPTAAAGFFQAGTVSIPTVLGGGTAFLQIEVWDTTLNGTTTGATFAQAEAYSLANNLPNVAGLSKEFSVVTGDPNA